jgi:hypothetical protein
MSHESMHRVSVDQDGSQVETAQEVAVDVDISAQIGGSDLHLVERQERSQASLVAHRQSELGIGRGSVVRERSANKRLDSVVR